MHRGARAGGGDRLEIFVDLRLRLLGRELGRLRADLFRGEIAQDEGDLGVVDPGLALVGRRGGVPAGAGQQPQGVEGGNFVGQPCLACGQGGGDAGEGGGADDLPVAGADGDRGLETLFCGDNVNSLDQPVALARVHRGVAAVVLADGLRGLRRLGLVGLAVERAEGGRADQGGAGEARQDRAREPVDGNAAMVVLGAAAAVGLDRRLIAQRDCDGAQRLVSTHRKWRSHLGSTYRFQTPGSP